MKPIIYDVAVSIDGYISGPNSDISSFPKDGQVVEDYLDRMQGYAVAIMGRKTYEFGYAFGLAAGQNPYPSMETHVFSRSIELPDSRDISLHDRSDRIIILDIKKNAAGPIYLCGGGEFAGWMLSEGLIDVLRLKRTPIILGGGTRLFGEKSVNPDLTHKSTKLYEDGTVFQEFKVGQR